MFSDWDEIKCLAADFQKAQLALTLQKLSERNCVEVVSLLLQKKLISVEFTNDGKEYITSDHLEKEMLDEIFVNGGRINLVEMSKSLNVDFAKIEYLASKIAEENVNIQIMLGQLIEKNYVMLIAEEINEKLAQRGKINVSDLTAQYDLPTGFVQNLIEQHLGNIIRGRQDPSNPRAFFTQAYIQRCKSKIRGTLVAINKPTTLSSIHQQIGVPEKIIHSVIDEISPAGCVNSKLSNARYIPHIYVKMQYDWLTSLYKQNGFLEYDAISKLGISDPKQFIKKLFPNEEMLYLKKSVVGSKIIDLKLISALNECNLTKNYVDLSHILPSNMSDEDIDELFQTIISVRNIPNNYVYLKNIVFSKQFLARVLNPCTELAIKNAKEAVENGLYQQYLAEKQIFSLNKNEGKDVDDLKREKREERRKKASSNKASSGANNQGREIKTKLTKKFKRFAENKGDNTESDINANSQSNQDSKLLDLVKIVEIEATIGKVLMEEGMEHLSGAISALYHNEINETAINLAQSYFEATPQTNRRQNHASLQEKINTLMVKIRLYEKGLRVFPTDVQSQMLKYLMKTLGNDICTEITIYVAKECNLNLKSLNNLNIDQRCKIAQECDPEYRSKLVEVNKALSKTFDEFVLAMEDILKACDMIVKKVDKKKNFDLIVQHKKKLCQQLYESNEHGISLHLTSLIIFTSVTGFILHASGRFVSQILAFIRPSMSSEQNNLLMRFHDLVLTILQSDTESDEYKTVSHELDLLQWDIKKLAESFEMPGVTNDD